MQPEYRSVSLNLKLPPHLLDTLKNVSAKLTDEFPDQRNYDTTPHIALLTKFFTPEQLTEDYIKVLNLSIHKLKPMDLSFQGFSLSEDKKYVFLDLNHESSQAILKYREELLSATESSGLERLPGYVDREYVPHITILKVDPAVATTALAEAQELFSYLRDQEFTVNSLVLTEMQTDQTGNRIFPVIKEYMLN